MQFARHRQQGPGGGQRDRLHRRTGRHLQYRPACSSPSSRWQSGTLTADEVIGGICASRLANMPGATLYSAGGAGPSHRRARQPCAIPVHASGRQSGELNEWGPKLLPKLRTLPGLADVQQRSADPRLAGDADRSIAPPPLALGITAAGDRQHAVRRLRAAAGLDDVHAAQPISRGDGGRPAILAEPRGAEVHLRQPAQRHAGAAQRGRPLRPAQHAAGGEPLGAVSLGHASRSTCRRAFRWGTR